MLTITSRPGLRHFRRRCIAVSIEILFKQCGQFAGLLVIGGGIRPGEARIQRVFRHARAGLRNHKAKQRVGLTGNILQRAAQQRIDHGACVGNVHALPHAVGAAGPAGVDQPAASAVAAHLLAQQVGVDHGVLHHERTAEAGAEGGLRLFDAFLGAGNFGGVAGQKMIHGLLGRQAGNGRQHTKGVGGQKDHILGMPPHAAGLVVAQLAEQVGSARVFGDGVVRQVDLARLKIDHHVFEDGAEAAGHGEDFGLVGGAETDDLGIAAALEVKNPGVAPAVLVVADQTAARVGGQGGLAGAAQPKKQGGVAARADVGGAVHGQYPLQRKQVVEHGEHGLFDLAAVARAGDERQLLPQVNGNHHI